MGHKANWFPVISVAGNIQTYDAKGNNTIAVIPGATSAIAMAWDSENRMLSTQSSTARTENTYDSLHRRVSKKVYSSNGSGGWTLAKTIVFTYDGWNVIMEKEYGSAGTLARTLRYTWGRDMSGSLQGAGGVGGLLMAEEINGASATPHYYCYDANGNVTHVVDEAGQIEAQHRYTAFGGDLESVSTTSFAQRNPWRFSTKYLDREVESTEGFYYYGYRFYLTALGRWPSRDPIQEAGGINLYGMVGNDGIDRYDVLGFCSVGETKNCKVVAYAFESERVHNASGMMDDGMQIVDTLDNMSEISGLTGVPGALKSAKSAAKGITGAAAQALGSTGSNAGDAGRDAASLLMKSLRAVDHLPNAKIYLYMTVQYEECVCDYFWTTFEKKTRSGKSGPSIGMPSAKGPLTDELEKSLCPKK